ncbi:Regulator of telomere elongation helicase 1 [Galdieria sulphuraria]|uniref:Regulator of telomere elongation helicase 1 homolog n=1 Tax=Galdieria sulphuraria TaxID=130081 RepID=M2WUT7_GALSU|nr:DNA excision repair protein ERCC-2 [Galdieria sulphuraria]EME27730.1 DNA excision repair protein ERCC-2 [Galdieria sulphuraria]GJD10141.1 Regulator of telomere elongation helicase 1 [Galdieria sulphuraria]|eukprot:XP_005704250.1 DNA excision repair protein ERCC-2 [Galdieria sulphuraria]
MVAILGVEVAFPFQPYPVQRDYMEKVIQALQTSQHAMLESPTGTGKTLCLLCSTLAWRQSFIAKCQLSTISKGQSSSLHHSDAEFFQGLESSLSRAVGKENQRALENDDGATLDDLFQSLGGNQGIQPTPRIIYTSRTHSQLAQAIDQLRKTIYRPSVIVLGSREQLCIHPQVSHLRGSEQNRLCRSLCESKGCKYRNNLKNFYKYEKMADEILDLEDWVNFGKKEEICPYYLAKEREPTSELIFLPYNYLVDLHLRESLRMDFSNDIILFDEAHHIEDIAANCASFELTTSLLDACIHQLQRVKSKGDNLSSIQQYSQDAVSLLLALFRTLLNDMHHLLDGVSAHELVYEPSFLFQLLSKVNLTPKTFDAFSSKIEQLFGDQHSDFESSVDFQSSSNDAVFTFLKYMRLLFKLSEEEARLSYVVCIYGEQKTEETRRRITLSYWCFNPGVVMKQLVKGVRCLVLTSGTLSPLSFLESELQIPFPIQLENRHIISQHQLFVGMLGLGPSGEVLNSSYRNRSLISYKRELGRCIYNFSLVIPGGMLVFFPSYQLLMDCVEYWKTYSMQTSDQSKDFVSIWDSIYRRKSLVVESKEEKEFQESFRHYQEQVDSRASGCILFGVCRGRMSEGIDFSDEYARAVILVGIPFPPLQQRKVKMKQHYLSTVKKNNPQRWYRLEALRAMNQAIGRVIRHEKDFGAIILCDERFPSMVHELSLWVQPFVKNGCYSFGALQSELIRFFKNQGRPSLKDQKVTTPQLKTPQLAAGDEDHLFQVVGNK